MAGTNFLINILTKVAKKSEKDVKGLNKALGGLKSAAMSAAAGFLGAGALVAGIKKATDAFAEQELVEKKLQQALGSSTTALLDQASALQKTTVFGDEATIAQQAFLASLGFTESKIKDIIPVAMDLASATGMSLESAVRNTAKTFSGLAGELGEMVPQLRELTAAEMKAGKAVEVMAGLFGGAASAETETMTGSLQQMKNAAGDTAEAVGKFLSPAIDKMAKSFKTAAENATSFMNSLTEEDKVAKENTLTNERNSSVMGVLSSGYDLAKGALDRLGISGGLRAEIQKQEQEQIEAYNNSTVGQIEALDKIEKLEFKRGDTATDFGEKIKKVADVNNSIYDEEAKRKDKQLKDDLRNAALSGQSASESMKSVVRAQAMEAAAGAISSIMRTIPFPLSLVAAAGAGGLVSGLIDKALGSIPSFATGGDFTTQGEQLIRVGDNPSGRERVQVTPLDAGGEPTGGGGSVVVNVSGNVMSSDYTEEILIPHISDAIRRGASLGAS